MCVIIVKQKNNKIPMKTLENASLINPHGLGVTWLDTFKTDYLQSDDYEVLFTERPFIAHFRYATIGKINRENTHPFVCGENKDEILMMNGTVAGYGNKNMTDSKHLANELGTISREKWKAHLKVKDVNAPNYCRFVSINTKKRSFQIYNRELFTYRDGVWYSKNNIFRDNVVAVYGTLKYGYNNYENYLRGKSIYMGVGVTQKKYPLVIERLPYLSPVEGLGHHVDVDVFRVDDDTFKDLDRLEGHPRWYNRKETSIVMTDGSVVTAWVYFNDIDIRFKDYHESFERVTFNTKAQPFQKTIESEDSCPECNTNQLEFDGFNNYLCDDCGEWYIEDEILN